MKLSFISADSCAVLDGIAYTIDIVKVDNLHAIQVYEDGLIECEWINSRGLHIGNSFGDAGLDGGEAYIQLILNKVAEAEALRDAALAEEVRLAEEAAVIPPSIPEEIPE